MLCYSAHIYTYALYLRATSCPQGPACIRYWPSSNISPAPQRPGLSSSLSSLTVCELPSVCTGYYMYCTIRMLRVVRFGVVSERAVMLSGRTTADTCCRPKNRWTEPILMMRDYHLVGHDAYVTVVLRTRSARGRGRS